MTAAPSSTQPGTVELEMAAAALVALAEHGIPADVQELLIYGNPDRGIAPGAFSKAVRAILLRATPAQPAGMREALATALARRLCQLFDSGGESQRSVRARHASAIFQLLSAGTSDSREWQKCDADPVTYLEDCERRAALPAERPADTHGDG